MPLAQRVMLALLFALLLLVQVRQPFPAVAPLHHIPTLLLLVAAPFLLRRWPLSNAAVGCVFLFFVLHTIGGRYTYTNVPYDALAQALTGHTISEVFGFTRNHYDRLVHLAYGLLAVLPVSEALRRHGGLSRRLSLYVAVESVLAVSLLYELFEWLLALTMAGPAAEAYNGQQGDMWDAQKDMALALFGALISATVLRLRRVRLRN
ncbi:MAG: putative rane protein [Sphingomonadales bacterium]|nr:putative rane protein [Sphingomonadales bacterium]